MSGRDAPWVRWMPAKYLKHQFIWLVSMAQRSSWVWRGLISVRPTMMSLTSHSPLVWLPHSSGCFSSKSAWEAIRARESSVSWASTVWYAGHVPRYAFLLWLVMRGRIKTQDRLQRLWLYIVSRCALCCRAYEDLLHLFLGCSFSRKMASLVAATLQLDWRGSMGYRLLFCYPSPDQIWDFILGILQLRAYV